MMVMGVGACKASVTTRDPVTVTCSTGAGAAAWAKTSPLDASTRTEAPSKNLAFWVKPVPNLFITFP